MVRTSEVTHAPVVVVPVVPPTPDPTVAVELPPNPEVVAVELPPALALVALASSASTEDLYVGASTVPEHAAPKISRRGKVGKRMPRVWNFGAPVITPREVAATLRAVSHGADTARGAGT